MITREQAIEEFEKSPLSELGYDRIVETLNYFIFSINEKDIISDPVAVDKNTKKVFGYNPILDGR